MMAEEKKEPWLNYLALATVILAVCATLATFKGGQYSTRSVLSQTQASDQWAFFQAKSVKSYIFEARKEMQTLNLLQLSAIVKDSKAMDKIRQEADAKIESYKKKLEQFESEKALIQKEAKALEAIRDESKLHGSAFGLSVIFLQISILLSSIAALMKKKMVWYGGLIVGAAGVFFFFNGFWLFLL
jgi:hypothetical protein